MANDIDSLLAQAVELHRAGRLDQAKPLYRSILDRNPARHEVLQLLGMIAHQTGDHAVAVGLVKRAIALAPAVAFYRSNLGEILRVAGQPAAAADTCRAAIALDPRLAAAHVNLGLACQLLGDHGVAKEAFVAALTLDRGLVAAHAGLALSLMVTGEPRAAEAAAVDALRLDADHADALDVLAACHYAAGFPVAAVEAARRALTLSPTRPEHVYATIGSALASLGSHAEALAALDQAASLAPDDPDVASARLLIAHYAAADAPAQSLANHVQWAARHAPASGAMPALPLHEARQRLRVGYVSPDFRRHSVAYFVEPFLAAHDRERYEIFYYADLRHPDEVTGRIRQLADHWRDVTDLPTDAVAQLVRDDGIDILVDLAGHTAGNRLPLFGRKPAPVQMTYLGYPATTGVSSIDYRITDAHADPPGRTERFYAERLLCLPETAWCYRVPDGVLAPLTASPALAAGYVTFGSFNTTAKLSPACVRLWARVVTAVPGSRLLLKARDLAEEAARAHWRATFVAAGLPADRLTLLGPNADHAAHLAAYRAVDIALDTFPYHGTTTTCEALAMGVPVVTLAGQTHVSRVGVSLLTNVGRPELIAADEDRYVDIAALLAGDWSRLARLRATLPDRLSKSPLGDAARFARNLEAAYASAWSRYCEGDGV